MDDDGPVLDPLPTTDLTPGGPAAVPPATLEHTR